MDSERAGGATWRWRLVVAVVGLLALSACGYLDYGSCHPTCPPASLRIVVMDPLSDVLACDCVAGYAQRKYDKLGKFLENKLRCPVEITYTESLSSLRADLCQVVDLIIGKFSVVVFDAEQERLCVRAIAMLTGKDGEVTQTGLFVVRHDDPANSVEDLKGRRILLGPQEEDEKRAAALATLEAFGLPVAERIPNRPSCNAVALAVVEKEVDAGVISSYAMPLLEGCGTIDKGALRVIGRTDPVPFIGVFATGRLSDDAESGLLSALQELRHHPSLLRDMESRDGFLPLRSTGGNAGWTDWRGPNRQAVSEYVPEKLPSDKRLLWSRTLTGPGMSGLAVDSQYVMVADKDMNDENDIFRCLDAYTGRELWKLTYPAPGDMDFTNSPRANPVIYQDMVYLLGAFGDLHCVKRNSGELVWKKNLVKDFGAELPTWGMSSTPLIVDDKLIVNPGAENASFVALDRSSGKTLWATPGDLPGYASFILANFGGMRQIIGYDAASLVSLEPDSGALLWRVVPQVEGDFNVPTPVVVGDRLLVSTENNGTRLYGFDSKGRIKPTPEASNDDLAPDTSTPVILGGMVFGSSNGLVCLDLDNGLKTLWKKDDAPFRNYCSFITGNGRVLVVTEEGIIWLLKASKEGFASISHLAVFAGLPEAEKKVWSHPALLGNRFYIRNMLGVYCFLFE